MSGTICTSSKSYFETMAQLFASLDHAAIDEYAQLLFRTWQDRRRVFVFGNGGSALTASHHICDYIKTAAVENKRRLQAFSLVDNAGLTTAIGNDIDYEHTLSYPLESYAEPGDVAVAISCSGNSPNVVKACQWAKQNKLTVVALTGFQGGKIGPTADIHINIPSDNFGIIEDLHLSIGHVVTQTLYALVSKTEADS